MSEKPFEKAIQGLETGPQASDAAEPPRQDEAALPPHPSVAALRQRFGDAIHQHVVYARNEHCVYVAAERVREIMTFLRDDPAQDYAMLLDETGIDYGAGRPLELVYQLWSFAHKRMLRVKVVLPLDALEVDSVEPLWKTANWLEREVYDMFGIHFRGHPDLRRILMPENYAEGFPLRKDFPLRGRFSRAEQTRRALSLDLEDNYTLEELAIGGDMLGEDVGVAAAQSQQRAPAVKDEALGHDPFAQRAPVPGSTPQGGN